MSDLWISARALIEVMKHNRQLLDQLAKRDGYFIFPVDTPVINDTYIYSEAEKALQLHTNTAYHTAVIELVKTAKAAKAAKAEMLIHDNQLHLFISE